ncbi:MAG: hypothetical protein MK135_04355 [Polyangiaceae bacterium]|nr:hypothetical protein [Polyangiaceae bacterium]
MKNRTCFALTLALLLGSFLPACFVTAQEPHEIELLVAGTEVTDTFINLRDQEMRLSRADLAFGTLTLCPGSQAGALCTTARMEWLDSVIVDALDQNLKSAGTLTGVTGETLSWMYDLGFSSQLTQTKSFVLDAAEELGGYSCRVEGEYLREGIAIPFEANLIVQQTEETEQGMAVVRKSTSDSFSHLLTTSDQSLTVTFDPRVWFADSNMEEFLEDSTCMPEGPPIVCRGQIEERCDADGMISSTTNCTAQGQVCVKELGCQDKILIPDTSSTYRSLQGALVAGERPTFAFN